IVFYFNIWRKVSDPKERDRVGALLVTFGVAIVFWMTFYLNTNTLNVWARDNTDRVPGAVARLVTDRVEELAENAPPAYFNNAGPLTPRPAKSTFQIVSDERYLELEAAKKITVKKGDKVYVTQEKFDKIYAHADSSTP